MALAWTAHELRGPITAVRSAIEHALSIEPAAPPETNGGRSRGSGARSSDEVLERARRELDLLAEMVDDSLKWATGRGIVRRRPTDLAAIVEEAIDACTIDEDEDRIRLELRSQVWVTANPGQLARAIANVVRNALALLSSRPDGGGDRRDRRGRRSRDGPRSRAGRGARRARVDLRSLRSRDGRSVITRAWEGPRAVHRIEDRRGPRRKPVGRIRGRRRDVPHRYAGSRIALRSARAGCCRRRRRGSGTTLEPSIRRSRTTSDRGNVRTHRPEIAERSPFRALT